MKILPPYILFILVFTLFYGHSAYSQMPVPGMASLNGNANYFEFAVECPVKRCEITGAIKDTNFFIAPAGSKFILIDMTFDKCIIRFDVFSSKLMRKNLNYESEDYMVYKYFVITKAQFDFKTHQIYKKTVAFSMGTLVIPVKFWFKPFDFSKDVTLGTTLGVRVLLNPQKGISINALLGIGITSNTLDSTNTNGHITQPADILSFSPTVGIMLEFGSAQFGVFSGFDFPSRYVVVNDQWLYANKPWLSFAIGYSIFSAGMKHF